MEYIVNVTFSMAGEGISTGTPARLGIRPSRTIPKGNVLWSGWVLQETQWEVTSRLAPDETVDRHFRDVLAQLEPVWEQLKELSKTCTTGFRVFVQGFDEHRPLLEFAPDILEKVAELGAVLQLDIY